MNNKNNNNMEYTPKENKVSQSMEDIMRQSMLKQSRAEAEEKLIPYYRDC